jgi:hypothetical protein
MSWAQPPDQHHAYALRGKPSHNLDYQQLLDQRFQWKQAHRHRSAAKEFRGTGKRPLL